jgi:mRNA interferase YafQ
MKYTPMPTSAYKRALKKAKKSGLNLSELDKVIAMLADGEKLPPKYRDHKLLGNFLGLRECHVTPDWLLVYKIEKEQLVLVLYNINSHSNLFN